MYTNLHKPTQSRAYPKDTRHKPDPEVAARIRGTLAGCTAPVNASTLAQRFAVPEDFVTAEMAKVCAGRSSAPGKKLA